MAEARRRRKSEDKILKHVEMSALYFHRPLQKSGPTQGPRCSTVYFPIVIENIQNITSFFVQVIKVLAKLIDCCWDHFSWRGRAGDLFSVREF